MSRSHELFQSACQHIPGGVNSPVRAFKGVGGDPVFFTRGEGPWLYDADGKRYIDYVASWGPMIAGHAHPAVIRAVQDMAANGLGFGAPDRNRNPHGRPAVPSWCRRWIWCAWSTPAPRRP